MVIDNKIKDGKLQYNISREAAKIPALSLSKINKDEQYKNNRRTRKKQAKVFKPSKPEKNRELESTEGLFPKQMENIDIKQIKLIQITIQIKLKNRKIN